MTRDESLFKIGISLDLQILGKFWDNINTQLHEIYNTVQVVFGNLITKILHIVPLSRKKHFASCPHQLRCALFSKDSTAHRQLFLTYILFIN